MLLPRAAPKMARALGEVCCRPSVESKEECKVEGSGGCTRDTAGGRREGRAV